MEMSTGGTTEDDQASPLVMAVASSPRVSRKRLGSNSMNNSNNNTAMENNGMAKDDNLPGAKKRFHYFMLTCRPLSVDNLINNCDKNLFLCTFNFFFSLFFKFLSLEIMKNV